MKSVEDDPVSGSITEDTSHDLFLGSSDIEDQQVLPRVGDEYQVKLLPLITDSGSLQFAEHDAEVGVKVAHSFAMGLPIPIMWKHDMNKVDYLDDAVNRNGTAETENGKGTSNIDPKLRLETLDLSLPIYQNFNLDLKYSSTILYPLPGSVGDPWSFIEQEGFLLGLYIFGKNLIQVKRFVGSREMGDVLSFYYGKFYRSEVYCRWSKRRKIRSKMYVDGQKIFTGWRQQKILSRLFIHVPMKCQMSLLEVSKKFEEGKISLEDYVSTLKASVGLNLLISAVGIGYGKNNDLLEPVKAVPVIPSRLKIPVGKACSSLTYGDIIKFISGDVRLSKARSNDLFWEAVWPRLLARGWHSEQPKNRNYANSKHSLVFLIPGVEKFSRRLLKGNHYFDSVTEVLNKVALDPRLIELGNEATEASEENGWCTERKLDIDFEHLYNLRDRYLQRLDLIMYTTVDTSLDSEEDRNTVRTLRSLPLPAISNSSSPTSLPNKSDDSSEESVNELDTSDMKLNGKVDTITSSPSMSMFEGVLSGHVVSVLKGESPCNVPDLSTFEMENNRDQQYASISAVHPAKIIKCQFRRRAKPATFNYLSPSTKRRRLTACSYAESSGTAIYFSPDTNENILTEVGLSEVKVSTSSSSKGSPVDIMEEDLKPQTLIDLNLPHVPLDFETYESLATNVEDDPSFQPEANQQPRTMNFETATDNASAEIHPVMMGRRQGTRNRPLTTKALEALACEFLTTKPKPRRRGMGEVLLEGSIENPLRRRGRRVRKATLRILDSEVEETFDEKCNSSSYAISKAQGVWTERVS
ncbi:hypothetical protein GIB67_015180 [Kingdonia uniflora]|uniref:SANT domain-containing protein n=1 Tax=Kingdonia uniflora TaxID=39325 RepID=A0A7J7LJJ3_9MAGN|nr:hypothetical protein GIB67_015180 [Kingdonia uniflora]